MSKTLVIVESPTKAKTIQRFLPKTYTVRSSMGHIRDLPKKEMGVDIEHDFKPKYVTPKTASKTVKELKELAKKSDKVILATDEDREGEAISWHLLKTLGLDKKTHERIAFHEITKKAIENALEHPRELDMNLVNAQQARRILDRLVGYELSPLLWKKVAKGLSAGRVQSVAVRLIVEREREIEAFKPEEYWTLTANLENQAKAAFEAKLAKYKNKSLGKFAYQNKESMDKVLPELKKCEYKVVDIQSKEQSKKNPTPFVTSTLQQAAHNKLGFSSKQTMMLAQQLYEGIDIKPEGHVGLITYMRTDSMNLANDAVSEIRNHIEKEYGKDYLPNKPVFYKTKSKGAQEAHEAIRPTEITRTPESLKDYLNKNQYRLYELIWQRTLACQMNPAIVNSLAVDIQANDYIFRANGSSLKFDGFMKVYPVVFTENVLPELSIDEIVKLIKLLPEQHFTQPPARYSEASLVKALEEYGIGRPSTYAPTISTIQERNYVVKNEEKRLEPTEIGTLVNDVLVKHFPGIVDYEFTAKMEHHFDEIAEGNMQWVPVIKTFYHPFKEVIEIKSKELDKKELTEKQTDKKCPDCGSPLVIKMGRFGKFLACSNYPDCKFTQNIDEKGNPEEEEKTNEKCPTCGADMVFKRGRFGKFMACSNYPKCKTTKAITKGTGVKCPKCGKGEIVEKRSKGKRIFYGCDQYPDCDFALWSKPTGKKCPECKSLLVYKAKGKAGCSNKECKYTEDVEE